MKKTILLIGLVLMTLISACSTGGNSSKESSRKESTPVIPSSSENIKPGVSSSNTNNNSSSDKTSVSTSVSNSTSSKTSSISSVVDNVYSITVDKVINGSVRASTSEAEAGEVVYLSATPEESYQLKLIYVETEKGTIDIEDMSFVMPDCNVIIKAEFEAITTAFVDLYDSSTITNTSYNGVAVSFDNLNPYFPSGMLEDVTDVTATGLGKRGGLGLGSGSSAGYFTLHFKDVYQVNKVTINAIKWKSSEGHIVVNGKELTSGGFTSTVSTDGVHDTDSLLVWEFEYSTNVIKIEVPEKAQRVIVFSIQFDYELRTKTPVTTNVVKNHGKVELEAPGYDEGEVVEFKVIPAMGYLVDEVNATTKSGSNLTLNGYSFTMPNEEVEIQATFKRDPNVYLADFFNEELLHDNTSNGILDSEEIQTNLPKYFENDVLVSSEVNAVGLGKRGGLGIGSGSSKGYVNLTFKESFKFTKVIITAVKWSVSDGYLEANGLVNGLELRGVSGEYDCEYTVEYDFIQPTNILNLSTSDTSGKRRCIVYSIAFFYEEPVLEYENLKNLNIYAVGDSILAGSSLGRSATWYERMGRKYNMTLVNDSISGTCVASMDITQSETNRSDLSMVDRFEQNLAIYENEHPGVKFDVILLEGGRNDNSNHLTIGENNSNDITEVLGAFNYMIQKFHEKYKDALIILVPPWYYTKKTSLGYNNVSCGEYMQSLSQYYKSQGINYIETIFACDKDTTGINFDDPEFRAMYSQTSSDVSHLNVEGHKLAQTFMESEISKLLADFNK